MAAQIWPSNVCSVLQGIDLAWKGHIDLVLPLGWGSRSHQAACFPEYFALQSGSCILALGGAPSSWAKLLMTIATMLALVNQLVLGPRTAQLMVKLYDTSTGSADQPLLDGSSDVKKTFGMVHGISMLLDLLNLFAVFAYLCMVAG
ncbi:DUF4149 domain-containing protein [Durusdinium trenchii]|uniref:DUF4149 domain-containing protein n=1 Tax=Durusdinium trenchii TaxID=1381693 RepID=A0ABP0HGL4_9DINO